MGRRYTRPLVAPVLLVNQWWRLRRSEENGGPVGQFQHGQPPHRGRSLVRGDADARRRAWAAPRSSPVAPRSGGVRAAGARTVGCGHATSGCRPAQRYGLRAASGVSGRCVAHRRAAPVAPASGASLRCCRDVRYARASSMVDGHPWRLGVDPRCTASGHPTNDARPSTRQSIRAWLTSSGVKVR